MLSKSDLHSYQDRTVTELFERSRVQGILPMGAGKTISALTALQELQTAGAVRQALVVAPKRVAQLVWTSEPRQWAHTCSMQYVLGFGPAAKRRKALFAGDVDYTIQTIDNLQWLVRELEPLPDDHPLFDLLILDESSRMKNPRSKRARALFKVIHRFRNVWFLTGTPRPNGIEDQFGPMKLLSGGQLWGKSFDRWRQENMQPLDYNGYKWGILAHREKELEQDIMRYSFAVGADELPYTDKPQIVEHWVDMPPDTRDAYATMVKEMVALLKKENVLAVNKAVATAKLEQLSQGFLYRDAFNRFENPDEGDYTRLDDEKLQQVEALVQGANEPVLVAYWYKAQLDALRDMFPGMPYIGAGVRDEAVAQAERAWNKGDLPILGLHPASAGHGLNLQKGGSQMIADMPIWSAELWDQLIKRINRQGQTRQVFVHVVCSDPGHSFVVDRVKLDRVSGKITDQEAFNAMVRANSKGSSK